MKKNFIVFLFILIMPINVSALEKEVKLVKCVDGDTFKFSIGNKEQSARFLAVDTPETKHPTKGVEEFGPEASEYTCNRLTNAKKIVLEYDDNSTKEDKYGRALVWVFVDGDLLQEELIEKGYAKVAYLYDDYKYTEKLQTIEKKAKNKKVGIWSTTTSSSSTSTSSDEISIDLGEILSKIFNSVIKEIKSMI